ncbi:MAG: hypothetical protein INQ03_24850 [Candidatus Heimdallarchaeota archaeon]|nr:hypothetical protein [Candidatus Heimdallarchaeota archaeon]
MVDLSKIKTGTIVPLGDGSVGKSAITKILFARMENRELFDQDIEKILSDTHKSTNIEMEFLTDYAVVEGETIKTSLQFYVFPGQVQKESSRTVTFDEILGIFEFLPALKNVQVLLLVYDVTRFYTLQSLDSWLSVAIEKSWVNEKSLVMLVANKVDIQSPDETYVGMLVDGIHNILTASGINIPKDNVYPINTSCLTLEGINSLHKKIVEHIAKY